MTRLPWDRVDRDQFHSLVNDLLSSEFGVRYLAGEPDGGPDGGIDGWLADGAHPMWFVGRGAPSGATLVQAKHYKSMPSQAMASLRTDVRGSSQKRSLIEDAKDCGASNILLITSVKLKTDYKKQLQALVPDDGPALTVFGREEITLRIQKRPWLESAYFGLSVLPGLRPVLADPRGRPGRSRLSFVGRQADLKRLSDALGTLAPNEGPTVLVVAGPPGVGKTRFIEEAARDPRLERYDLHWVVGRAEDAVSQVDGLLLEHPERELVVVLDEAEGSFASKGRELLRSLRTLGRSVRVVLVTRSLFVDQLTLFDEGIARSHVMELAPLPASDVAGALEHSGVDSAAANALAERVGGNMWLAGRLAELSPFQLPIDDYAIRKQLVDRMLGGIDPLDRRVFELICAVSPIPLHSSIDVRLAEIAGVEPLSLADSVTRLQKTGLLSNEGRALAPVSRLGGHYAVDVALRESSWLRGHLDDLGRLPAFTSRGGPQSNIDNGLAALAIELDNEVAREYCEARIQAGLDEALDKPPSLQLLLRSGIDSAIPLAAPTQTVELVRQYALERAARERAAPTRWERVVTRQAAIEAALYKAVCSRWADSVIVDDALDVAMMLEEAAPKVEGWMNPFVRASKQRRLQLVDWARRRCAANGPRRRERSAVFNVLLSALRPSWRDYREQGDSLVQLERAGRLDDAAESAAELLLDLCEHPDARVRARALQNIFEIDRHVTNLAEAPLVGVTQALRQKALENLAERISKERDVGVLVAAHRHALRDFLVGSHKTAKSILEGIERDLPFRVGCWFADPGHAIDDVGELFDRVPEQNRWSWFVEQVEFAQNDDRWRGFMQTGNDLARALDTPEQLLCWLRRLDDAELQANGAILSFACSLRPDIVDAVMRDRPDDVPERYVAMLRHTWLQVSPGALTQTVGNRPLAEVSADEATELIASARAAVHGVDAATARRTLSGLADHPDPGVRLGVLKAVGSWVLPDARQRVALTTAIVNAGTLSSDLAHQLHIRTRYAEQWFDNASLEPLKAAMRQRLAEGPGTSIIPEPWLAPLIVWATGSELPAVLKIVDGWWHEYLSFELTEVWANVLRDAADVGLLCAWTRRARMRNSAIGTLLDAVGDGAPGPVADYVCEQVAADAQSVDWGARLSPRRGNEGLRAWRCVFEAARDNSLLLDRAQVRFSERMATIASWTFHDHISEAVETRTARDVLHGWRRHADDYPDLAHAIDKALKAVEKAAAEGEALRGRARQHQ